MEHRWAVLINILYPKAEASLQQGITKMKNDKEKFKKELNLAKNSFRF